jgi:inorganic pyrophosphatase
VQGHAKIDAAKYNWNQTSNPAYADAYTNPKDAAAKFDIPAEADIQPAAERPSRFDRWFYLEGGVRLIELPGQKD